MIELTKEQAILEHRRLWNWIADRTLTEQRPVQKTEYMEFAGISEKDRPAWNCFCCEYAAQMYQKDETIGHYRCQYCPLMWGVKAENTPRAYCCYADAAFKKWEDAAKENHWEAAAGYARMVARLPER